MLLALVDIYSGWVLQLGIIIVMGGTGVRNGCSPLGKITIGIGESRGFELRFSSDYVFLQSFRETEVSTYFTGLLQFARMRECETSISAGWYVAPRIVLSLSLCVDRPFSKVDES